MPAEQHIYVLEVVVIRIELEPLIVIHSLEGLNLNFKFSQRVNFDIDSQYFASPEVEDNSDGRNINMNYGRTFLFIATSTELRQLLQIEPYQISLFDGNKSLGTAVVNWKRTFPEMIKSFGSNDKQMDYRTVEEKYEMKNEFDKRTAKVKMFIRMSCFGPTLEMTFQEIDEYGYNPEYIFKHNDLSNTFTVDRYVEIKTTTVTLKEDSMADMKVSSFPQFFDRDVAKLETGSGGGTIDMDFGDYDVESLRYRPSENKFFDFLNVISVDVKTHGKHGTCVTIQKAKGGPRVESVMVSRSIASKGQGRSPIEDPDSIVYETAEQIRKKLCGNRDCPAVRKFTEYGICEPAFDNNLGDIVEPPVTCGMRHLYKTMSNYGIYSRPKYEELPFVPFEPIKPITPIKFVKAHKLEKKSNDHQWHSETCPLYCDKSKGSEKKKKKSKRTSKTSS